MLCGACRWRVKCTARGVRMCRLVLCKARAPHLSADCTPIFGAHPCAVPTCAERAGPAKCQYCHHRHGVFSIEPTEDDDDDDKDKDKDVSSTPADWICWRDGAPPHRPGVLWPRSRRRRAERLPARLCSMRGSKAPLPRSTRPHLMKAAGLGDCACACPAQTVLAADAWKHRHRTPARRAKGRASLRSHYRQSSLCACVHLSAK